MISHDYEIDRSRSNVNQGAIFLYLCKPDKQSKTTAYQINLYKRVKCSLKQWFRKQPRWDDNIPVVKSSWILQINIPFLFSWKLDSLSVLICFNIGYMIYLWLKSLFLTSIYCHIISDFRKGLFRFHNTSKTKAINGWTIGQFLVSKLYRSSNISECKLCKLFLS